MSRLGGHARAKYVTGARLATSADRDWQGLLVERWRHSAGDLGAVEVQQTEVIVMLRGRLRVRRRGDGRLQDNDAVPGTVWLCPAGVREDMIRLYGEVEDSLHIYLPASLLAGTALQELDVDPDRVRLQYEGGFRDPLIEQIAGAVRLELAEPGPAGNMLAEGLSHALRVHMLRRYSNLRPASVPLPPVRGALDVRRLARVKDFIDAHLAGTCPSTPSRNRPASARTTLREPSRRQPGCPRIATSWSAGSSGPRRSSGSVPCPCPSSRTPAGSRPRPTLRAASNASWA